MVTDTPASVRGAFRSKERVELDASPRQSGAVSLRFRQLVAEDRAIAAARKATQDADREKIASQAKQMKSEGRCPAVEKPRRGAEGTPEVCGRAGTWVGYCRKHYLSERVQMQRRKHRFHEWQVPWSRMSAKQLRSFVRLPLRLSLAEIIEQLNRLDLSNTIEEVAQKPVLPKGPLLTRVPGKSTG
ncbi:MAG: hypothetical protein Rhirs2KO_11290 [Rhizobiaceae bacterium]